MDFSVREASTGEFKASLGYTVGCQEEKEREEGEENLGGLVRVNTS